MIDLGTLGGENSSANAISSDGVTVIGISATPAGYNHAFKYKFGRMFDLGTLGGSNSEAIAVSEFGNITIGNSFIPGDRFIHAFVHTEQDGMLDLGTLGGDDSSAVAISQDGKIIIGDSTTRDGMNQAFIQQLDTIVLNNQLIICMPPQRNMISLGTLGGQCSHPAALSYDGSVIVGDSSTTFGQVHAFKYTRELGMVDLGTLGGMTSLATSVSADGNVIVGSSTTLQGEIHAFKYTPLLGMIDLGTLGGNCSEATKVSRFGNIVVGHSLTHGDRIVHAFKYNDSTGMKDLGTLGGISSCVTDVSYYGSIVVGYSDTFQNKTHGFIHTEQTGMIDIGTLGGDNSLITGISLDGQVICGYSDTSQGTTHAFIHRVNMTDQRPRTRSIERLQRPRLSSNLFYSSPSNSLTHTPSSNSSPLFSSTPGDNTPHYSASTSLNSSLQYPPCSFPEHYYYLVNPPSDFSTSPQSTTTTTTTTTTSSSSSTPPSNKSYLSIPSSSPTLTNFHSLQNSSPGQSDFHSPQTYSTSSSNPSTPDTQPYDPTLQVLQQVASKLERFQQQQQQTLTSSNESDHVDGRASNSSSSYLSPAVSPGPSNNNSPNNSPFGTPESSPFGTPEPSPFGTPEPSPFGTPEPSPFGTPESSPFGTPEPSPFGTPEPSPFETPDDSGISTPLQQGEPATQTFSLAVQGTGNPPSVQANPNQTGNTSQATRAQTTTSSPKETFEARTCSSTTSNSIKLVDINNTFLALKLDAEQLSNILINNHEEINQALNSDCTKFGPYGFCLNVGNRYLSTKDSNVSQTIGMVGIAFKFSPYLRIGLALDKTLTRYSEQYKIKSSEPTTTLYCIYEQSEQGTGAKLKVAGTQRISNLKISRIVLPYTEGGRGHTKMESSGFEAQASYGVMLLPNWILQPIIGIQYTNITRNKYKEFPGIQFPITYNQSKIQTTNIETAALLEGKIANWCILHLTGSIKHRLYQNNKAYTGTIPYIGTVELPFKTKKKQYSLGVGTTFLLTPRQILRLQTQYSQSFFRNLSSLCVNLQYSIGF